MPDSRPEGATPWRRRFAETMTVRASPRPNACDRADATYSIQEGDHRASAATTPFHSRLRKPARPDRSGPGGTLWATCPGDYTACCSIALGAGRSPRNSVGPAPPSPSSCRARANPHPAMRTSCALVTDRCGAAHIQPAVSCRCSVGPRSPGRLRGCSATCTARSRTRLQWYADAHRPPRGHQPHSSVA